MNEILATLCHKSVAEITNDCERDNFMTATQALEYKLIDEILK